MNVVPFLCRMVLNLHQKRSSSVTSGWLFHRAIRREIVAPSFVLMAMVQQSYPRHPSFHRAIRREIAVPSFVLMAMVQQSYPRHPPFHRTIQREIAAPSFVLMAMVQQSYPRHQPFHRAIRRETVRPSFVLMGDGAAKLPPSSAIPPRNRSTIICFDGRWCKEITPAIRHSVTQYDVKSPCHHSF